MKFSKLNEIANAVSANENRDDERTKDLTSQLQASLYQFGSPVLQNEKEKEQYQNMVDCIPMINGTEEPTYVKNIKQQFIESQVNKKENIKTL